MRLHLVLDRPLLDLGGCYQRGSLPGVLSGAATPAVFLFSDTPDAGVGGDPVLPPGVAIAAQAAF